MWVGDNEISRLDYSETEWDGRVTPGYLMPHDTSKHPVVVQHPSHSALLMALTFLPARIFNYRVPATRGEAIEMVRRQLQAADPA